MLLFSAALLVVFLHSAWGVKPSVRLEICVSSPKVELAVTACIEPEVEVLGDIYSVKELTVTVDVNLETGFDILGMEYIFMNLFRPSSPSGVMCCTSWK